MSNTAINIITNRKLEPYYTNPSPILDSVALPPSVTYAKGTLLGELTAAPGTFKAYAAGNADGSQFPKRLLAYDVTTDASGNISGGTLAPFGMVPATPSAPAYFRGVFRAEDLVQSGAGAIDANAVAGPYMKLVNGTVATGVVEML